MVNMIMMAMLVMISLVGLGAVTMMMPVVSEVTAQGNMTVNITGNMTDAGSGNVSGMVTAP
jgi:hypothetical protein